MPASLLVWERAPRWAAALRRELRKARRAPKICLIEVRSEAHCARELEAASHSLLAVEVTAENLLAVIKAISGWRGRFPQARFLALAARHLPEHELSLREAGASHFVDSPRRLAPVVRLVRRHLALAPREKQALEEAIWAALPW